MKSPDIVMTGVGMVTALGIGRQAFAASVLEGHSGVVELGDPSCSSNAHAVARYHQPDGASELIPEASISLGAPIAGFDAKQFVKPRKALKVMCREIQTSFAASQLAVQDAGLDALLPAGDRSDDLAKESADASRDAGRSLGKLPCDRIGTVFGSEMLYGNPNELSDAFAACVGSNGEVDQSKFGGAAMRGITPLWMLKYLPNMPACHYGIAVNAHGPNNTVTVGDVSGPTAVMEACGYLLRGIADAMIATACGSRLNMTRSIFTEDQPLATPVEPIAHSSRPHATDADGLIRGEAAGGVILETGKAANARGAVPIAEVVGWASRFIASESFRSGVRHNRRDVTSGRGSTPAIVAAIEAAMKQARLSADQLSLVVGHAMGDPSIDSAERQALQIAVPNVPLALPTSGLGHTGAASGMMGLITAALSLQMRQVPPVPHADICSPELSVSASPRELQGDYALAISHTSPGLATAIVLKRPT